MGDTGDTGLIVVVVAVVLLFAFVLWPAWTARTGPTWNIEASVSPVDSGSVTPAGNSTVGVNQSITFTFNANANATFLNWVFDGANFGSQPQISISPQAVNSSHKLIAYTQPKTQVFSVTPNLTVTQGQRSCVSLTLRNDGGADVGDIRLKLNDPYGVFTLFPVQHNYFSYSYTSNILNRFMSFDLLMNPQLFFGGGTTVLNRSSTAEFLTGANPMIYGGADQKFIVSSNVQPGVYQLSFSISYVVIAGSFTAPPNLSIPWSVTVTG